MQDATVCKMPLKSKSWKVIMGFVLLLHEYTHKDYEYISITFVCIRYLPTHWAVSTIPMNKIPLPNFI